MPHPEVTMATETAHNPKEPRHFMRMKPTGRRVRVRLGDELLAETVEALRVQEIGRDMYDPVFYLPPGDIRVALRRNARTSHCPLKGDAIYFDLVDKDGRVREESIAWSYPEPFAWGGALAGRIAFYPDKVAFEDAPR